MGISREETSPAQVLWLNEPSHALPTILALSGQGHDFILFNKTGQMGTWIIGLWTFLCHQAIQTFSLEIQMPLYFQKIPTEEKEKEIVLAQVFFQQTSEELWL